MLQGKDLCFNSVDVGKEYAHTYHHCEEYSTLHAAIAEKNIHILLLLIEMTIASKAARVKI